MRLFRTHRAIAGALVAATTVVLIDVASKCAASRWAPPHTSVDIGLVGVVRPLRNPDFSLELPSGAQALDLVLMGVGLICGAWLACALARRGVIRPWMVGLGLGGGAANTVDRALNGGVADFLVTGPIVINVADLAVVVAVLALLTHLYLASPHRRAHRSLPSDATTQSGHRTRKGQDATVV